MSMTKYIVQHRRGTAEQWALKGMIKPEAGELVIEIDEENSLHKLKIGDGEHTYKDLHYLMAGDEIVTQTLAKALPRVVTVTLDVSKWKKVTCVTDPNLGYYSQPITLDNITEHSRLDLQPDAEMLAEFQRLNLVFVSENKDGTINICSVGDKPLKSYTMQATIVETDVDVTVDKIVGITASTPTAPPVDYVIEEGDATVNVDANVVGDFTYRKWNNGLLEVEGYFVYETNTSEKRGNGYYIGFKDIKIVDAGGVTFVGVPTFCAGSANGTGVFASFSPFSGDTHVRISYYAIVEGNTGCPTHVYIRGKWK